ncbi:sensor histidine kinase [Paenibacillus tritici]|uniref:histidine kinase n=1 Tax=Paenibacillus tritici TaxID=1873425 RepID=A0ABX2DY40_9BACL|nr:ATP-binding protein [Paenibacillus tritici]NQX49633.1 sensor histidine kinase [Paenibacillus tritici]QUL55478.1 sensor histidine kinase [Paenibacillus tritici]
MEYVKIFFVNTALLITLSYLANLIYKYTVTYASEPVKKVSWVLLAIFAGWISTFFGYRLDEHVIFDLRFVPLIISTLAYPQPLVLIIIGVLTGLTRLTFGVTEAALVGVLNLSILGFICAGLSLWVQRSAASMMYKGLITILVVNVVNVLNIAVFGVIPAQEYIMKIMPVTFPAGLVLSALFALIIRDFHLDLMRTGQIVRANELLSEQTEELHKNKIVLEERAKQLMLASQFKSEFLANMSHELRTPLNSIINLSQLIEESDESRSVEELSEYGGIIHRSGEDLLSLINDILDLSKVEAGKLDVIMEDLNVSEVPDLLLQHFSVVAKQKQLTFSVSMDEEVPAVIHTDPQRVQQILRNLLSNAFKFTMAGSVSMNICVVERQEGPASRRWIAFEVQDTGIGIPPEKHDLIFEAFEQADTNVSRKYGGTGLGLSISNDLARLLGGFITLHSREGQGSVFALHLPLDSGVSV